MNRMPIPVSILFGAASLFMAVTGYANSRGLITATGCYMAFTCVHDIMFRDRPVVRGAAALVCLVAAASLVLSGSGDLLRIAGGATPGVSPVWSIPLFLLCMVLGEAARRTGGGGNALLLILVAFCALSASAASLMLGGVWTIAPYILSLLVSLLLTARSGGSAYRLSLSLVEKIV